MSNPHTEAWRQNVRGKVAECVVAFQKMVCDEVPEGQAVGDFRAAQLNSATQLLQGLRNLFSQNQCPIEIQQLSEAANNFYHSRQPKRFQRLIQAIDGVDGLQKDPDNLASFGDIFDDYKKNKELDDLADQLVVMLERLIDEESDTISGRLERDLSNLLEKLKGRKKGSLSALIAISEIIGKIALEAALQSKTGIPGGGALVDIAKHASKIMNAGRNWFVDQENEFVRMIELRKNSPLDVKSLPDIIDLEADDGQISKLH